jgi:excisionase family DNA binding protein
MPDNQKSNRLLSVHHVARRLSCTENTIYSLIQDGSLKAIRIGKRALRITESSLDEFLESREINPEEYFK